MLGLSGVGLLLQLDWLRWPVGITGAGYLCWLAYDSWKAASREFLVNDVNTARSSDDAMRAGILLSVTNPQNIAYWAAHLAPSASCIQGPSTMRYSLAASWPRR